MRFVTLALRPYGPQHVGLLKNSTRAIDFAGVSGNPPFDPTDMVSLIAAGDAALAWLRDVEGRTNETLALDPDDIVSSGTPAGVGHARTPPEFMKAGDVLETEIVGPGLLRNKIGS